MPKPTEKVLDVETAERLLVAAREKLWQAECSHKTAQEQLREAEVALNSCSTAEEVKLALENRRPFIERGFAIYGVRVDAQLEVISELRVVLCSVDAGKLICFAWRCGENL